IKTKNLKGRRTGLGTTGEGDMIAALGLRYGTPEATAKSVEVHQALALAAFASSVQMAKERGAFEVYNAERERQNPYVTHLREAAPELVADMEKHGRRNIACLTIAPTGTTSLMTRTSSGIEPVFMPVYKRRRKVNANDVDVHVDFVDESGDAFEEFIVYHPKFLEWMRINGIEPRRDFTQSELDALVSQSPYNKATANDIDWLEKVKMQGAVQKWVDHSISVTINLPADTPVELVDRLYMEAWKAGCKGCTIYRDGCRAGVLVSVDENKKKDREKGVQTESPEEPGKEVKPSATPSTDTTQTSMPKVKRPIELEADVVRFQNNKEKWIAFVGLKNGRPYEIFTGLADDDDGIFCPKSVSKGKIIKATDDKGNKRYDFQFINKRGYKTTIEG
ncbi:MAG: ribonucleoside-diphosphate reductase, adenosylcobalamin-dependent, partial [Duncaniella sp.]|nr:ribonucleoside-diphosphate reductase, adenosylcobalamin-dependent [Duncaniella sp.]